MRIEPISIDAVCENLAANLRNDTTLASLGVTVERGEPPCDEPSRCPWLGVYRTGVRYEARALGVGAGYRRQIISLAVIAVANSNATGQDCEQALEALLQATNAAILNDVTLGGVTQNLRDHEVQYTDYSNEQGRYIQTAIMRLTFEASVNATA